MTRTAGYSGTPLVKKLGIKPGFRLKTRNAPNDYPAMIEPLPEGVNISSRLKGPVDMWHVFSTSRKELEPLLPRCLEEIHADGMIWVSWPKKSSGLPSDLSEDIIRAIALPLGLVDVKVCAVDQVWSGLKLVVRRENRRR